MDLSLSKRTTRGQSEGRLKHYQILELKEFERGTDEAVAIKSVLGEPLAALGDKDVAQLPLVIVGYDHRKIERLLIEQREGFTALRPIAVVGLEGSKLSANIMQLADIVLPPHPREDDLSSTAATLATLAAHIERLPRSPRDTALTMLQFMYTRGRDIESGVDAQSPIAYGFPLAEGLLHCDVLETQSVLQDLSARGLLDARHVDRLFTCPSCRGYQVPVKELCPECKSTHLGVEESIHHFRCGHVGPESDFNVDGAKQCPKCFSAIRHIGVEYNRPGRFSICRQCNFWAADPDLAAWCSNCDQYHSPADLVPVNINTYVIAQSGVNVARNGRWGPVPVLAGDSEDDLDLSSNGEDLDKDYSKALALKVVELAQQDGRAMTIYKANLLHDKDISAQSLQDLLTQTRDVLREVLRESDVVVNTSDAEFLILLPASDSEVLPSPNKIKDYVYLRAGLKVEIITVSGAKPLGRAACK
ncbi:response regulator receiver protein [gamma proteobacterium BDW918]|jgi:hypothetical protein|uniref:Thaumarchaeal output domain-containing protein n=1 Tax=Zhongshania aliphaticivorans TaxID=1470434 RepID=A0A127M669_9GAMM|nr:hypothetical protein [Zhongshania aliphaticivorans]AMO68740.1 hypothetical protein AZF00_10735 [Zhongshania aliphaticivorans]EIF43324.1 response regulator receiver protein [gamma proteobacterium BDW918]